MSLLVIYFGAGYYKYIERVCIFFTIEYIILDLFTIMCSHWDEEFEESPDGMSDDWIRVYCDGSKFRNSEFCSDHVCGYNGCLNHYTCTDHECQFQLHTGSECTRRIFDESSRLCARHICINGNCTKNKYECDIHMCINCRNREKEFGYKKCYECLTYIDIIETMLLPEYYFGAIPRDIINILKEYV